MTTTPTATPKPTRTPEEDLNRTNLYILRRLEEFKDEAISLRTKFAEKIMAPETKNAFGLPTSGPASCFALGCSQIGWNGEELVRSDVFMAIWTLYYEGMQENQSTHAILDEITRKMRNALLENHSFCGIDTKATSTSPMHNACAIIAQGIISTYYSRINGWLDNLTEAEADCK